MKYSKEQYLECNFYNAPGEGEEYYSSNIVRTRKDHNCAWCGITIPSKSLVFKEKCILKDEGWRSCYTCLDHLDEWIEKHE